MWHKNNQKIQLLISVTSIEEAQIALENGADIIDLKDPRTGALGALPASVVNEAVAYVRQKNAKCLISSTIGDLPMLVEVIAPKIDALLAAKVDFIKIGFFESTDYQGCLDALKKVTQQGANLIAVLFAEIHYSDDLLEAIKQAGFKGVMLDTAKKNGISLCHYYSVNACQSLAEKVIASDMHFGLAGSISAKDIGVLRAINPSYLGFRGAVCEGGQRERALNAEKLIEVRKLL